MLAFAKQIETFFHQNQKTLSDLHPGLSLHTLKRELTWLWEISNNKLNLNNLFKQLLEGRPLAHITGYSYFYDSVFRVNQHTLIPRPESEILVEIALQKISKLENVSMCDIGTGSGAIGLSIAKRLPKVKALLSDISEHALSLAKDNHFAQSLHFSKTQNIEFIVADRFNGIEEKFDLVVSNPPYIKSHADRDQVHKQVLEYEPELALFLPDNEYIQWFEDFFNQVSAHLNRDGIFIMEGHEAHLDELAKLMGTLNQFKNIRIVPDLTGRARFIESIKNG